MSLNIIKSYAIIRKSWETVKNKLLLSLFLVVFSWRKYLQVIVFRHWVFKLLLWRAYTRKDGLATVPHGMTSLHFLGEQRQRQLHPAWFGPWVGNQHGATCAWWINDGMGHESALFWPTLRHSCFYFSFFSPSLPFRKHLDNVFKS